jgi:signal transduction histidine kinase
VTAREALDELRAVLGVLRNEAGVAFDFPDPFPDLRRLVDASTAVGVAVDLRDEVGPLPVATARAVHRVVQEGLTNVHKHAPGAGATVEVRGAPGGEVTIVVANGARGDGGEELPGTGVGLVGLNERVRLLGGRLRSGPDDLSGWRLEATIPWLDAPVAVAAGAGLEAGEQP